MPLQLALSSRVVDLGRLEKQRTIIFWVHQ